MAMPPADVSASELFRKLQERPRPSEVVPSPCKDGEGKPIGEFRIQVLTQEQHDEARERAFDYLTRKRGIKREDLSSELLRQEQADAAAKEILALACLTVDPLPNTSPVRYARVFADGQSIARTLTADEIGVLFAAYEMVQRRFGPYEGSIESDEELSAWIKRLGEGASAHAFLALDWHALISLCMSLAHRAYLLSVALDSQWESLPDSLRSTLEICSMGIGYYGEQPAELTTDTSESRAQSERMIPDEPITLEQAAEVAKRLHKHGY
jgi:hypothetical protein